MSAILLQLLLACTLSAANAGITGLSHGSRQADKKSSPDFPPDAFPTVDPKLVKDLNPWAKNAQAPPAGSKADSLSPPLQKTDYPTDKRPKVDVLHFKHPYPVVQDSTDFDADFVKDENSDNGEWKAQTEYDRLRHKLLKEKGDVAKALAAKTAAEKELQGAMKREKDQVEKVKVKKAKKEKEEKEEKEKKAVVSSSVGEKTPVDVVKDVVKKVPVIKTPGGVTAPGAKVKVATDEVQKAMEALEECKKQLEEARARLKKLQKELDEAKKVQTETQAALDKALKRLETAKAGKEAMDKATQKEYEEYLAAKRAYERQAAMVAKMEQDIKVAAEKVKSLRDAEDKDGGVYNTGSKSGSARSMVPIFTLLCVAASLLIQ